MKDGDSERFLYVGGFLLSSLIHITGAVLVVLMLQHQSAQALKEPQVFTVTLEGGEKLGGISQAPKAEPKKGKKVVPPAVPQESVEEAPPEKKVEKRDLEGPTAVEDPEKRKAEQKAKQEAERKKKEAEAKKKKEAELEIKKKAEAAKKRKAAEEKKRREKEAAEKKKREAAEKKKRDQEFQKLMQGARDRYTGESANAGGEGFGAARIGGKGMGGGTLASVEFIAYRNTLERHIKSGWHWLPGAKVLQVQVLVTILPTGVIQHAQLLGSSGQRNFDDSVLRAVYKSSPVPPAPPHLYDQFREVRITFDSHQ